MNRSMIALAATALAVIVGGPALADSRLFSIQTDTPGVTVTGAASNGTTLMNMGGEGALTFFRIDNPAGQVACTANIAFTLSTGDTVQRNVDFCAANWDVTLALAASPSQPPASGSAVVTTDDPSSVIVAVFVNGIGVPLQSQAGQSVSIAASLLQVGQGCQRDMAVELADGRRIARNVNVCVGSGAIVVPVTGGSGPVATQPPQQTFPQPTQPPAQTGPQVVADMTWQVDTSSGTGATLLFGSPQGDIGELTAACDKGSETARMTLARPVSWLTPGATVNVRFRAGTFDRSYSAVGSTYGNADSGYLPQLDLSTGDPLWPAIIRESTLYITLAGGAEYGLSLKGSAAATRPFLAVCNPAPAKPTAPPPRVQPGPVGFICGDGRALTAVFDNVRGTATVYQGAGGPISLTRVATGETVRFTGSGAELVGRGEAITWVYGPQPPTTCRPN